jgi:SAM-dependent methyltransferase
VSFYQRLLGHPFVYNRVRPLAVGGIDMSPFYRRIGSTDDAVVLDVGCGTGDALRYLRKFDRYLGIDTDPIAIKFAEQEFGARARVGFECRQCEEADVTRLEPTEVLLCGVLHHMPDEAAKGLLRLAAASPRLRCIATSDIVFLPGEPLSNLFARLDRGRFCRRVDDYVALAEAAGLRVKESEIVRCHPRTGLAKYWMMTLVPQASQAA